MPEFTITPAEPTANIAEFDMSRTIGIVESNPDQLAHESPEVPVTWSEATNTYANGATMMKATNNRQENIIVRLSNPMGLRPPRTSRRPFPVMKCIPRS